MAKESESKQFRPRRQDAPAQGVLLPTLLTSPRWRTAQPRFCEFWRGPGVARARLYKFQRRPDTTVGPAVMG
jgi:hypothetical protein